MCIRDRWKGIRSAERTRTNSGGDDEDYDRIKIIITGSRQVGNPLKYIKT